MFDIERFRLTPEKLAILEWREKQRLDAMTPSERAAYYENLEANAWREALSDELWGSA